MILVKLKSILKNIQSILSKENKDAVYRPIYRIVDFMKNDNEEFIVTVQLINKNIVLNIKPEEILADNNLVDQFSPQDIRTLTYLGYLGINGPQFKILAQRLSQDNAKLVFALKKKGAKNIILKTANDIMKDKEILNNLNAKDAHVIGYTMGSENAHNKKTIK